VAILTDVGVGVGLTIDAEAVGLLMLMQMLMQKSSNYFELISRPNKQQVSQ